MGARAGEHSRREQSEAPNSMEIERIRSKQRLLDLDLKSLQASLNSIAVRVGIPILRLGN